MPRAIRPPSQAVIVLPASAISYAPYGDSVFVVADMKTEDGKAYRGVPLLYFELMTGVPE